MLRYWIKIIFSLYVQLVIAKVPNDSIYHKIQTLEMRLKHLAEYAFKSKNEQQRLDSNKVFFQLFKEIFQYPESFQYPFDSLKKDVSFLMNKDKTFRIITWNVPKNDGTHLYFGFIQHWFKEKKNESVTYRLHTLIDVSNTLKNSPETYVGKPDKWFGMLYYQIIEGIDYWILLGWDGNEKLIQRKFIDVLYFKKDGTPIFGKDVFKMPKKNPKRIMFQYSSDVVMTLRYEPKKNAIVFSHLSPDSDDPYLKNQYQFYGPDGSFDAFVKDKDKWKLVEDIDMRNPDDSYSPSKKPDPKKQKPLYQPK
ncbi:MAG: hypothetical protein KatS3mg027_1727 [Bacteroidia bacterium]|nr:MAG: hypothetical protein KatS3mg027_1727 [Bacteroidia bacterium]